MDKLTPTGQHMTDSPAPQSFLKSVAEAYVSRYDDMTDLCFVFPNKRSGTFFLKSLSESLGDRTMLAPDVMGVDEFMARVSGLEVVSRIDVIFRLYRVYRSLSDREGLIHSKEDLLDFDRFAPWAETLAGDFSEVEKYDVDAEALFRNVSDYHDIQSNFLTEEQCRIIERYFGYYPTSDNVERFWKNVGSPEERSRLQKKFVDLWSLLPRLFEGLVEDLRADGLALPGTTYREAMRLAEGGGVSPLPWSRVVVVGFNMLSTTEARLFSVLRDSRADDGEPYGEFFWDATGPVLGVAGAAHRGPAVNAMQRNLRNFPMPGWAAGFMARSEARAMPPSITVAAAPSNAAQTKIASMRVGEWLDRFGADHMADARVAVVLPDENLLLPLVHSLPPGLKAVNLTMGYSLRYTAVASFVYHLRRLQSRPRKTPEGLPGYYHEDFRLFMSHPLVQAVAGAARANEINSEVAHRHMRVVSVEWVAAMSPVTVSLIAPVPGDTPPLEVIAYVRRVLNEVDAALDAGDSVSGVVNTRIERSQIALYQQALSRLALSISTHGVDMRPAAVFHLVDRLLAGESVTFEGEPLEGLQVMGLLETRALDFDQLVILSMNDKVMPRRSRKRTFVPDTLRRGYGLPASGQAEELYAYYFYRLISRAREVTLVYDARAGEGMRSGGKSRFLMQLAMLHARGAVREVSYAYRLEASPAPDGSVRKTDAVMRLLNEYTRESGGRNLSASALMNYCSCPVKFYYKNVRGLNDDPEAPDHISSATMGQIVHYAMLSLYLPGELRYRYLKKHVVLDRAALQAILDSPERIRTAVIRAVNKEHFHRPENEFDIPLTGAVAMVAEKLEVMVANAVRLDMENAPVELVGGEIKGSARLAVGGAPEVNVRYAFDRVDVVSAGGSGETAGRHLRIVDYKTGDPRVKASTFDNVFDGTKDAKYLLQLMLYARLLPDITPEKERGLAGRVDMAIHSVKDISYAQAVSPVIEKRAVTFDSETRDEFDSRLGELLRDIFDPEKPFTPTENQNNCAYCAFGYLCGRE